MRSIGPHLRSILCCFIAFTIIIVRFERAPSELPDAFSPLIDVPDTLTGVIVSLPDVRETTQRVTVEIHRGIQSTRIIASTALYPSLYAGDEVRVSGTLKRPESFATDGGRTFVYDQFLRKDGIFAVMQPAHVVVTGMQKTPWLLLLRMLQQMKESIINALSQSLPEPESSLAVGLIVGGKQGLGDRLIDSFTRAGMLQIVVLSGYNVMIVANVLMRCLSMLPKKIAYGFGMASIACFILMAGGGSAALRAGLMACIAISAHTFGKQYDVLRALFASALLLGMWNPLMIVYDPGFQFSFLATFGLIVGTPLLAPRLLFLRHPALIEAVAGTFAAELMLLPLLLWQTGNLSLVSMVANIIAMPAVPYAMGAGVLAGVIAFVFGHVAPMLVTIGGIPAYLPLAYIIKVATLSASLPFAEVVLPAFPFWIAGAAYAALACLALFARRLRQ
jgi:competence protein ComEC